MKSDLQLVAEALRRVADQGQTTVQIAGAFRTLANAIDAAAQAQAQEQANAIRQAGG